MGESLQEPSVSTRAVSAPERAMGRNTETRQLWVRECEPYVYGQIGVGSFSSIAEAEDPGTPRQGPGRHR